MMIMEAPPKVVVAYTGFGVAPRTADDGDDVIAEPGLMYLSAIVLPPDKSTVSAICVLNGSIVEGSILGVLYSMDGKPVLHTSLTMAEGPNEFQLLATAKPGAEWCGYVGLQATSPNYRFRSHQVGRFRCGAVDRSATIKEGGRIVIPPCYPPRAFTRYAAPWMMLL